MQQLKMMFKIVLKWKDFHEMLVMYMITYDLIYINPIH